MKPPIRVGAVSYLNAKPLYYRLCDLPRMCGCRWTSPAGWPSNWPAVSWTSR